MGFNLSTLKTDPEKEERGIWVDWAHGMRLKIAHVSTPRYQAASLKLFRRASPLPDPEDDHAFKLLAVPATARHILLDWENVDDEEGNPLPYTPEVGERYLREIRTLRDFVTIVSLQDFRYRVMEEVSGNSLAPSNGTSASPAP